MPRRNPSRLEPFGIDGMCRKLGYERKVPDIPDWLDDLVDANFRWFEAQQLPRGTGAESPEGGAGAPSRRRRRGSRRKAVKGGRHGRRSEPLTAWQIAARTLK